MMKSTGMARRVDELGRVVIPKELRRTLGINERDPLEIFIRGNQIVLRKYVPSGGCALCGNIEGDMMIHQDTQKLVCFNCTVSPMITIK